VLDMLDQVGTDVGKMTGQTPWLNLSSISRICLAGCSEHAAQSRAVAVKPAERTPVSESAPQPAHDSADASDFKDALDKATPDDLLAYMEKHPESAHVPTALRLMKAMRGGPANNQAAPAKSDVPAAKDSGSARESTSKANKDH
jgi:hypothetical protein